MSLFTISLYIITFDYFLVCSIIKQMSVLSIAKQLKLRILRSLHGSLFSYRFKDKYYNYHQNKLRGSQKEILTRLLVYLPYLKHVKSSLRSKFPFLDCGFGRGEFIQLTQSRKLAQIIGVDTNPASVSDLRKLGVKAYRQDMIAYLYLSEQKYCGISAFHVIEHLKFDELFDFLTLAHKKLIQGGVLLLETPNIENIVVSSTSFYHDHTHVHKVTREVLDKLLGYIGFSKIIFLPLHPIKSKPRSVAERYLFGSQDLGIIAYK